jgi:integrase
VASAANRPRSDGTVAYSARFRHLGRQTSVTFDDPTARDRFLRNVDALGVDVALDLLDSPAPTHDPLLSEVLTRHISSRTGITDGTRDRYLAMAPTIVAAIGDVPVRALTRDHVSAWTASLTRGGSAAKTVRNYHSLLSSALTTAVEDGVLATNVAQGVRIARTIRPRPVFLTSAEMMIFLSRVSPHYGPFVTLLFGTGLRFGEATALQHHDFNLNTAPAMLTVSRAWKQVYRGPAQLGPPKTVRGERTIALPNEVVTEVAPLLDPHQPAEFTFVNEAGTTIKQPTFWQRWANWADDAKHPDSPPLGKRPRVHDARHTHASLMIGQGISLFDLQHRLGHESIQTTANLYGHLLPEAQVQAARAASLAFRAAQQPAALPAAPES